MRKIRLFSLLFLILLTAQAAEAQYNFVRPFALGLRGSIDGAGVNARFFFSDQLSIEGQFNVSGGKPGAVPLVSGASKMGVGLVMYNAMLYGPTLRLFLGAGAHYGTWERYKDKSKPEAMFGFDAVGGLEYTFDAVPVSVSLDAKPAFNYVSGLTYFPNNAFGLTLRWYFGAWEEYTPDKEDKRE